MGYFKHATAIVETDIVGDDTRIWAFTHVLAGAKIGRECNICDHVFIENDVTIGDRVTIKCGVQIWDGVTIEDRVFVGPNATFTNDPLPRSKRNLQSVPRTIIKRGASVGANATILPGLTIGEDAVIGAGAVLTHDAPARAVLFGNPARITGYSGVKAQPAVPLATSLDDAAPDVRVKGVSLVRMPLIEDTRGMLSAAEIRKHVPFDVKRFFLVYSVPTEHVRGEHAHRTLHQFLVCVNGRCHLMVDDGDERQEFMLNSPALGVYLQPMVWSVQYKYSSDAVLLVLASDYYDASDYIRDYSEFVRTIREPIR